MVTGKVIKMPMILSSKKRPSLNPKKRKQYVPYPT
ncbi:MAG: hypothetical protein ACI8QQ_003193 [Psychroserpens sp.]|jgi:hypothetical protein